MNDLTSRTQVGKIQYLCEVCGKCFNQSSNLTVIHTVGLTRVKNRIRATYVTSRSNKAAYWLYTVTRTRERNRIRVTYATRGSVEVIDSFYTVGRTRETNLIRATHTTCRLNKVAIWRDIVGSTLICWISAIMIHGHNYR